MLASMLTSMLSLVVATWVSAQKPAQLTVPSQTFVMRFAGDVIVEANLMPVALQQRMTLVLPKATVETALKTISEQTGLGLSYNRDVVQLQDLVSVDIKNGTVADALRQVLRGQPLELLVSSTGEMALVPANPRAKDGRIVGRVVHTTTKQPIAGARVRITGKADRQTITNEQGEFSFQIGVGEHTLEVRHVGMVKQERVVTVESEHTVTVEIVMAPSASVLHEVVVTGTVVATERKAIATPITVITAEDIEKRGITRVDQLMRGEIPGLIAIERGTTAYANDDPGALAGSLVYSRGSTSLTGDANPIKTYVDGIEIFDPSYLGTIDPASIERIEVITGPQAATIYGSGAMGGVMQIFTKRGNAASALDVTLNVKYGILQNNFSDGKTPAHDHSLLLQGGNGPVLTYSVNVSHNYTGQWQPKLWSRRYGASLGATHVRGPLTVGGSISLTGGRNGTHGSGVLRGNDGFPSSMITASGEEDGTLRNWGRTGEFRNSGQVSTSSSQILALNLDYRPLPFWQSHLVVGKTTNAFSLSPVAPTFYDPVDTLFEVRESAGQRTTLSFNTTAQSQWNYLSSTLTVGGNGSWGTQSSVSGCLEDESATEFVECRYASGNSVTKDGGDRSWGGFGTLQLGFWGRGFITASLRGENNPTYGDAYGIDWTPNIGGTFVVEFDQLTIKALASYGSATRPPNDEQRRRIYGMNVNYEPSTWVSQLESPQLGPEYSRGPQGGIEIYYGNRGSLTINRYIQDVDNLIERVYVDSTYAYYRPSDRYSYIRTGQFQNVANMRQQGWSGQASLNLGPLSLKGTYSWDDSRITYRPPSVVSGIYLAGDSFREVPTHTGNFIVSYAHRGTSMTWVTNYIGESLHRNSASVFWITNFRARHAQYNMTRNNRSYRIVSPGYTKSNINISHRLSTAASFTMNVTNVFNSIAADVPDLYPSLGRQTLVGVSLRYP